MLISFSESGLPPSPGSLSDRSVPHLRASHGPGSSPYAAAMVGGPVGPEEVHASSLSLASTSSSVYSSVSTAENFVKKLWSNFCLFRPKKNTKSKSGSCIENVRAIGRKCRRSRLSSPLM